MKTNVMCLHNQTTRQETGNLLKNYKKKIYPSDRSGYLAAVSMT